MMMLKTFPSLGSLCFVGFLLLSVGCTNGGVLGAEGVVAGVVKSASSIPPAAELGVVWTVSSGSPDYNILAGTGALTSDGFAVEIGETLNLGDSLAEEALNDGELGVGVIIAMAPGTLPAEGRLDERPEGLLGATPRYAIIFRKTDGPGTLPWAELFPAGFSCGVGVDAEDESLFDSFTPVDCREVELEFGDIDSFDFVNWT